MTGGYNLVNNLTIAGMQIWHLHPIQPFAAHTARQTSISASFMSKNGPEVEAFLSIE